METLSAGTTGGDGKAKRKGHPKKTTGCSTCKSRHLRCDESKPICSRCNSGGFICGYMEPPSKPKPIVAVVRPNLLPKPVIPTIEKPPSLFRGTSQDQRAFDFFCCVTSPILSCYFDKNFWSYFLLQMSQYESTVWHSVLALGTLHEQGAIDDEDLRLLHHRNGLSHYNKAIAQLTKSTEPESQSAESVLVSCIIFVCIEIVLGNIKEARNHLQAGVRIIRSLDTPGSLPTFYQSNGKLLKANVVPIFDHFNNQSFIYGQNSTPAAKRVHDTFEDIPETFLDYRQARDYHTRLLATAHDFAVKSLHAPDRNSEERAHLLEEKQNLQRRIQGWSDAAEELLRSTRVSNYDRGRLTHIKLSHKCASMWVFSALNTDEMSFDAYVHDYDALVKLSRVNLNKCSVYMETPCLAGSKTNSHILQSVSPLFVVATKCRNPTIRRHALTLLRRHPPSQGFRDSKLVIRAVERVIELEEVGLEDLRDPTRAVVPSEWARVQTVSVNLGKPDDTTMTVVFQRKSMVIKEQWSRG
ncbi:hypothetical protein BKA65DRAFT_496114 [Rhexocercosporidium sp. MPI-PUGE-AT-0058]|nr:hypothetical protein BKA65DRAFT_496114 [Rhexocercosporidium sp. MPI-PUGE-AT-0058]